MSDLRLAVLGCGQIVRSVHLPVLSRLRGVRVAAIAESDRSERDRVALRVPGAAVYEDYRSLLERAEVDAALIALPTGLHAEAAVTAFGRALHVYLEKPMAATLDEADAIFAAWQAAGTVGRIGFNSRFNRLYGDLRTAVHRGEIGRPLVARTTFTAPWPVRDDWHAAAGASGGALFELASHHIDLMRWIFGAEILSVRSSAWAVREKDEAALLQLELTNGVRAQIFAAHGTVEENRVEVYGDDGKLEVNQYDSLRVRRTTLRAAGSLRAALGGPGRELMALGYALEKRRYPAHEPSYAHSLSAFVASVRGGDDPSPDLGDGHAVQRVLTAARESAALRRAIEVSAASRPAPGVAAVRPQLAR